MTKKIIALGLILLSFLTAVYFYPQMPDIIASHWDATGQVNGYMSKFWGLFLMPFISIGLYILFLFLPQTDPYRKNFKQFEKYFDNFIILIFTFLFYIYLITIAWNLGYRFDIFRLLAPAFAILFFYAGILMSVAKRNWFVGIRTPWTLSSDKVWNRTHQIGAKLFKTTAAITLLGLIWPKLGTYFLLIPIFASTIFVFAYSYFLYRRDTLS